MAKKEYQQPLLKVHRIQVSSVLLAGSGGTGATGQDALWKVKGMSDVDLFSDEENNSISNNSIWQNL